MKIQKITSISSEWKHKPVHIPSKSSPNNLRQLLYNEVAGMVKECGVSAEFSNKGIKLPMPNTNILNKLKKAGIHFETVV